MRRFLATYVDDDGERQYIVMDIDSYTRWLELGSYDERPSMDGLYAFTRADDSCGLARLIKVTSSSGWDESGYKAVEVRLFWPDGHKEIGYYTVDGAA